MTKDNLRLQMANSRWLSLSKKSHLFCCYAFSRLSRTGSTLRSLKILAPQIWNLLDRPQIIKKFEKDAFSITSANSRWLYIFLGILMMLLLGTVYSYSVIRVALESQFNIGAAESGMPYMVSLASYALFMFFTGRYIGRFPPRIILLLGGSLVALGWILSSFTTNIIHLTITYGFISGAGVGIAYGIPLSVIAKWFPDKKGLAVGLVLIGFGLSPVITAPIVSNLVEHYGVMRAFLTLGVSFGAIWPILSFAFKEPSVETVSVHNSKNMKSDLLVEVSLKEMVKTRSFKGIYLNFIVGTMIGLMMIGMTINVGLDYFKLDSSIVTGLMAIFAIFNGLGRPVFGWMTDRYSTRIAMMMSYGLIAISAIGVIVFTNHVSVYVMTFSIFWFNLGGWLAIAPTSILKLYWMKHYGQNYGLVFTAYGIGALAGVSSSGLLLDFHGNYHYIFYYVIFLCFVGMGLTMKYMKNESRSLSEIMSGLE